MGPLPLSPHFSLSLSPTAIYPPVPQPQTALLRQWRAEVIAPLQSLVARLSGLLPCPLVCLWFSQHGAVCVRVWEPALQPASVCTSGPFYKSAISLTLGKHSSVLPKADGPIDLNYWPAQGSHSPPVPSLLMKWKWLCLVLNTLSHCSLTTHRRFASIFLDVLHTCLLLEYVFLPLGQ